MCRNLSGCILMRCRLGLLPFIVLTILLFSPALGFDTFEIIDHRQKEMKIAQTLTRDINAQLLVNDFTGAVKSAQKILNWSRNLRQLFPEGSEAPVQNLSSASSDIWENSKAFQKAIDTSEKMATDLFNALSEGQLEEAKLIGSKLPLTCRACHQRFRN